MGQRREEGPALAEEVKRPTFERFKRDGPDWMAAGWEWGGASNDKRIRLEEGALKDLVSLGVTEGVQYGKKIALEVTETKSVKAIARQLVDIQADVVNLRRQRWAWFCWGLAIAAILMR